MIINLYICLILLVMCIIDLKTREIPDLIHGCLLPMVVVKLLLGATTIQEVVIGMLCVALPMFVLALLIPNAFGGGDIKLCAVCGAIIGWKCMVVSFFIAIVIGGIWSIALLVTGKKGRKDMIAFGPFLGIGIMIGTFLGEPIFTWYIKFLL